MVRNSRTAVSVLALMTALSAAGSARAADAGTDTSAQAPSVEQIIVTGQQQRKQVESKGNVGVLGDQDALSIPFNMTTYTSKLILDQQSETIGSVLENDPAVRVTYGSGNQSELFVVRGFPVNGDDVSFNGLYGVLPRQLISPELFENVQVLNGAAAFVYGAAPSGSVGGAIDLIPKRAQGRLIRVTGSYIADSIFGGSADLGERFGAKDEFGARLNAVYRSGDGEVHGEYREVQADSLDLDWQDGAFRAYLDMGYELQRALQPRPEVRLGAGVSVPAPPDSRLNYGQPWTYTSLHDFYSAVRVEYDLFENTTLFAAAGFRNGQEVGDYSTLTITNGITGAATGSRLFVPRHDHNYSATVGLHSSFDTGPLSHKLNLGGSSVSEKNFNSFSFGSFPAGVAASSTTFFDNLYNPPTVARPTNSTLPSSGGSLTNLPLVQRTIFNSAYLSDTVSAFDDLTELTVGVRLQQIDVHGFSRGTGAQTSYYNQTRATPVVGLVIKPSDYFSIYVNRTEELVQGPVAPTNSTTINPGQIFSPFVVVQYEAGAKFQYHGLTATMALYQMEQPSAFATPVAGSATLTQFGINGQQRNRGMELSFNGEPTDYLRVIGGVTLNDAEQTKTLNGVNDGKDVIGVPDTQANIGLEFIPPPLPGAVFTLRWLVTGPQYVDAANTQRLSGWTRLDLGARYVAVVEDHPVTFRLTMENVSDNSYWESAFGGYLVQAEPRTLKASVTFEY